MIEDGGAFYDMMKEFGGRERMSSHHRWNKAENASDIGIGDGVVLNEVLIGKTKDNKTWIQVEAHSTKTLLDIIMHLIDYILYKIIGKNVSQYGYSEHRDDFPIHIKFQEESKSQEERAEARKWSEKVQSNDTIELKG